MAYPLYSSPSIGSAVTRLASSIRPRREEDEENDRLKRLQVSTDTTRRGIAQPETDGFTQRQPADQPREEGARDRLEALSSAATGGAQPARFPDPRERAPSVQGTPIPTAMDPNAARAAAIQQVTGANSFSLAGMNPYEAMQIRDILGASGYGDDVSRFVTGNAGWSARQQQAASDRMALVAPEMKQRRLELLRAGDWEGAHRILIEFANQQGFFGDVTGALPDMPLGEPMAGASPDMPFVPPDIGVQSALSAGGGGMRSAMESNRDAITGGDAGAAGGTPPGNFDPMASDPGSSVRRTSTTTAVIGDQPASGGPGGMGMGGGAGAPWLDRLWGLASRPPEFERIEPGAGLGLNRFAADMLENPSRYDTKLFNDLLNQGLSRLDQAQEADRLNLLRDANRRLGPNSGHLTNEYIDLAAEYDRGRNEFVTNLAREAATTQMQDRIAALNAASGVARDAYSMSANERQAQMSNWGQRLQAMMQFGQIDRQLGRDAMDDYFRWQQAELSGNLALAQQAMAEFYASLSLAQFYANAPATGDPNIDYSPDPRDRRANPRQRAIDAVNNMFGRGPDDERTYPSGRQATSRY